MIRENRHSSRVRRAAIVGLFLAFMFRAGLCQAAGLEIEVPVGGDIQAAIDKAAAEGGGTVRLGEGEYSISRPIVMRSNVTLSGSGRERTRITTDKAIRSICPAGDGLENLAIERLGIRGIAARGSHAIHLTSRNGRKNHESIRISGVHASGTGWGVHIKGAEGVLIEDCEFIGNGVKGREGFAHNLYLRRCHGAVVVNTVLSGSTTGNGCNVSYSSNVRIENCEVMNNYFRGIRFADSDGCVVVNSRIGRNGKVGLLANRERVPAKNIEFRDNRVFENGEGGIQARDGVTGVVVNCRSFDNKRFDIDCADTVRKEGNRTKK